MNVVLTCFQQDDSFGPLTRDRPVALLPVFNTPLLQHHIELCVSGGMKHIHIAVVDHPQAVRRFVGDGTRWGAAITVWTFKEPCSGPETIDRLAGKLEGPVLLLPAEGLVNLPLADLMAFHHAQGNRVTKVLCTNSLEEQVETDGPSLPLVLRKVAEEVDTGIMVAESPSDAGEAGQAMMFEGNWVRIDALRRLWAANMACLEGRFPLLEERLSSRQRDGSWLGHHVSAHGSAQVHAPSMIGNFASLNAETRIGPYAMLGDSAIVDKGANVVRSLVFDHSYLGALTNLEDSVVAGNAVLNLRIGSWVSVTDTFLVSSVRDKLLIPWTARLFGKSFAGALLVASSPIWLTKGLLRAVSGKPFFSKKRIVDWSSIDGTGAPAGEEHFDCLGFDGNGLVSRLPGLIDVLRGRLALVGVRPVSDTNQLIDSEEWSKQRFEAPAGLFTPVDAEAMGDALEEEKIVAENLYAATRCFRLDASILAQALAKLMVGRA